MKTRRSLIRSALLLSTLSLFAACTPVEAVPSPPPMPAVMKFESEFTTASGHQFPVTILTPDRDGQYPLIIFSTGNFSDPSRYRQMLNPIVEAGYIIVSPTHMDAELLALDPKPKPAKIWQTRNDEIAFLATKPDQLTTILNRNGFAIDPERTALMGHSYGALIAQLGAGAIATDPDGERRNRKIAGINALVAWSPPGPIAKMIDAEGWFTIDVPSLTITGTADILPGFIDDWELHKASYEATLARARWLWVGKNVNHYFDGIFGRGGSIRPEIRLRFRHAIATTIHFLDLHLKPSINAVGPQDLEGVTVTKDQAK